MLSIANEGDRGANIKPSARRSIHSHCIPCNLNINMGRYGMNVQCRVQQSNAPSSELCQGADEVDNVMSKLKHGYNSQTPLTTRKNLSRRNSIDSNDSDDSDDDELFRTATQNEFNNSNDRVQSHRSNVHTRSPQNRQNISTLESSNIDTAHNISWNSNNYETTRRGGNKFKYVGLILLVMAVAIGVNSDYFAQSTDNINDLFSNEIAFSDDIKSLGAKYRVSSDSILKIESGISTILKNQDAASFIFIYDSTSESFNSKVLYNFVEELALRTVKYLRNHSDSIQNVIVNINQIETESELRALQSEVAKTGVMIVPNINNVPSELAMAFHYYCDEYNPLVKGSAILFTLDAAICLHGEKITHQFVESCLLKKWHDIHRDKIGPLLTRVVNVLIDITNLA